MSQKNMDQVSICPVAPGGSLLLLTRGKEHVEVVSAVTFAGQNDAYCIAVFGLQTDEERTRTPEPTQLDRITRRIELGSDKKCVVGPLVFSLAKNVGAESRQKPFLLLINTAGACGGWRSEVELDPGQEYLIATASGTARMTVLAIQSDRILVTFEGETEPREIRSCETFVHGLVICFVVHVEKAGWYLWVANAVEVVRNEIPFATTGNLPARDALLETIESLAAMPVVRQ